MLFLSVIALVSIPAAVYSIGYLSHEYSRGKVLLNWFLFPAFVASMALVVTVGNALAFLIAWELMSLLSYFLVVFDSEQKSAVKAGAIYIVMTHIGTACITAGLLVMFRYAGSFDYIALKNACMTMPAPVKNTVFGLLLAGFGTKAGVVPVHLWLPYAHPQAPSHVSAVMSGVMIKIAVYGLLRFVVFILGVQSSMWGAAILVLAALSCIVGIMYALMDIDIKRLLAYSSVENMGIILLGVGASLLFMKVSPGLPAVLALTAALYHLVNHAVFKSLLFFGAGSMYKATGIRNIERMGGLIKVMPWTAAAFLIGAVAISALPPFNGFVSEWLTFQALIAGAMAADGWMKVVIAGVVAVLALTGGLAAACFVKAFGIPFLAAPRSENAKNAKESPFSMRLAMGIMAVCAAGLGLAAVPTVRLLSRVSSYLLGAGTDPMPFTINSFAVTPGASSGAFLSTPAVALCLIVAAVLAALGLYVGFGKSRVTKERTWGCGYYALDARTEYTSTAFSKPFRIVFSFMLLPYRKTEKIKETKYFVKSFRYETHTTQIFKQYLYEALMHATLRAAKRFRKLQAGSIHLYLGYIFLTILLLILFINRF